MKFVLFILMVLSVTTICAQQPIVLNKSNNEVFTIDHLQQQYTVTTETLTKNDNEGTKTYQYPFFGKLSHLDVRNPLEIVLFFDESNQMIVLDNNLSEKFIVNFTIEYPEIDPIYVASAAKNFYWVVDGLSKQIYSLDYRNRKLRLISNPIDFQEHLIYSDANKIYLMNNKKVMHMDRYGVTKEYILKISYDELMAFLGNILIYKRNNQQYSYDIINQEESTVVDNNN